MNRPTVLVVGAGLAGARCAETLRAEGFDGRVVLAGEEPPPPYERPALSKELLTAARTAQSLALRPEGFWREREIELLSGTRVEAVDLRARTARTAAGGLLGWDHLVLATGLRPRTLAPMPRGVKVLRTLADALSLRDRLVPGRRLVVVGAGFVGGEVATSAAGLGVDVTVVDSGRAPLERAIGPRAAALLADRYRPQGIDLRLGTCVTGFRTGPGDRVRGVLLPGGVELRCDLVLLGIGGEPVAPAGAPAGRGGIPTDACGRTSVPQVYACGDAAASFRPRLGRTLRVEHWTNAAGQGAAVARAILGREEPYDEPPFFWSTQLGLRLQFVGDPAGWVEDELEGSPESFGVRYRAADGRLVAALLVNRPAEVAALRRELAA